MPKSIHFLVLNMDKNTERMETISKMLNRLNCPFTRIAAIDGNEMDKDETAIAILKPRPWLFGKIFHNCEGPKHLHYWIYDGTLKRSFPNTNLNGHHGTKGLTLSNIKAFQFAITLTEDWICILEDDAEMSPSAYNKIRNCIQNPRIQKFDMIRLDARENGWGGTAGILYNKRIIPTLLRDLHPLSKFSILSHKIGNKNLGNLWDWKLWKYLTCINRNAIGLPCIKSGRFDSTIN
jgi:GR25 family glycosyltransferase involved in LPS biosynthesis